MKKQQLTTILTFFIVCATTWNAAQAEVSLGPDISKGWRLKTGDDPAWAATDFDDSGWRKIDVGKEWDKQGMDDYDGFAWYRLRFRLPAALRTDRDFLRFRALTLRLGQIDDVDETFLNGEQIGKSGRLPKDDYLAAWGDWRNYRVPERLLRWDADNVLAVRVYDHEKRGGMHRGPYSLAPAKWSEQVSIWIDLGEGLMPKEGPAKVAAQIRNKSNEKIRGKARWTFVDDEGTTLSTSTSNVAVAPGKTASLKGTFAPSAPGFFKAICAFEKAGDKEARLSASRIIGWKPEAIRSLSTRQPDFHAFWKRTLDALARVEPEFKMIPQPELSTDARTIDLVEMRSLGGVLVRGWYERPTAPGPHPAILRVPGYTSAMRPANGPAEAIVLSFNPRAHGNSQDDVSGQPEDYWVRGLDDKEGYFYQGAYMDCVRAVDFLDSRPEVDPGRIAVTGGSQGGGLSLATAALDRRVTLCAPDIPFLCDFVMYFKTSDWPEINNWVAAKPERSWPRMLRTFSYFDTMNLAPDILCPVFMGIGLQDPVCPAATVFSTYNVLGGPKEYRLYPQSAHGLPWKEHGDARRDWILNNFFKKK